MYNNNNFFLLLVVLVGNLLATCGVLLLSSARPRWFFNFNEGTRVDEALELYTWTTHITQYTIRVPMNKKYKIIYIQNSVI